MKYITTSKHPDLKEGIEITTGQGICNMTIGNMLVTLTMFIVSEWIEKGYIRELEEKEFTKSDMISLAGYISNNCNSDEHEYLFHNWLKQRK